MAYDSYLIQKVPGNPGSSRLPLLASAEAYPSSVQLVDAIPIGDTLFMGAAHSKSTPATQPFLSHSTEAVYGSAASQRTSDEGDEAENHSQCTFSVPRS